MNNSRWPHKQFTWSADTAGFSPALSQCNPPVVRLFGVGCPETVTQLSGKPGLAIVGGRKASAQGLADARWFSRKLSEAGLTIVSGLAQGIDAAAHEGAIAAEGLTVAVLGHGLNHLYPPEHQELAGRILDTRGALLAEYPADTPARPFHFPQRNRIIAALCRAVLIIEAAPQSGSLITVRHALDLGVDVFVLPGSIHETQCMGSNALIRQGAQLVCSPQELLEDLGLQTYIKKGGAVEPKDCAQKSAQARNQNKDRNESQNLGLAAQDPRCQAVFGCLGFQASDVKSIVGACGLPESDVYAALLLLELSSQVKRRADGRWSIFKDLNNS